MLITNPATAKPMEAKPSTKTSRLINGAITVLIIFKICKKTNFSWLVTTEVQGEDKKDIAVENVKITTKICILSKISSFFNDPL